MNPLLLYRKAAFVLLAVLVFVLALYTLEKTGVPRGYAIALGGLFGFVFWAMPVVRGATTTGGKFLYANHESSAAINSLAITVAAFVPVILADGGALFYSNPSFIVLLGMAISVGLALSGLFVSRQMRQRRAADLCERLVIEHDGPLAVRCSALVIAFCSIGLLTVSLAGGSLIAGWFFNIGPVNGMLVFALMVVLAGNIGGMYSSTRLATMACFLLIIAINLPLLALSLDYSGLPIGHYSFGNAGLAPLWDLEDQLRSLNIGTLEKTIGDVSDFTFWTADLQIAAACMIMLGMIASPLLFQQYSASISEESASRANGRAVLIAGFIVLSLFAFLTFSKLGLYQVILGTSLSDARIVAPFLYEWGENRIPLVQLCGEIVQSKSALLNACGGDPEFLINIEDLTLNRQLLTVAGAELTGRPFAFTAFLNISVMLMICSFATMTALAATSNLVTAFYNTAPGKVASGRIFVMRFIIVAVVALSSVYVLSAQINGLMTTVFSFSLLAASILPAVLATFHFNIKSSVVLSWSVVGGFAASILYFVLGKFGVDLTAGTGDELMLPFFGVAAVPPEMGGMFGLPFAVIVLVIAHYIERYAKTLPTLGSQPDED